MSKSDLNTADNPVKAELYPAGNIKITESPTETVMGKITATIKNTGEDIDITGVTVTIPMGLTEKDLAIPGTEKNMVATAGMDKIWDFSYADITGQFDAAIKPGQGDKFLLKKDASLGFTLSKMPLNKLKGDTLIEIDVFGPGDVVILNDKIKLTKVVDQVATLTLQASSANVEPGEALILTFKGATMEKFIISSSTTKDTDTFTVPGQITKHPEKQTTYTLDGSTNDLHMQTQVTVGVYNPQIKFIIPADTLDKGENAILTWTTEHAANVVLECTDKDIQLKPLYDPQAQGAGAVSVGPITKPTFFTAYAKKGARQSDGITKHVAIKPPVVTFTIKALEFEPYRKCGFQLDWVLKNAGSFEITQQSGQEQPVKLPVPAGETSFKVFPSHSHTIYKINVMPITIATDYAQYLND